ncbi:hypothetical protein [Blastococcus sp. URHD0036]|uniref:hypothetical protein n=1 Tax=Blastococcus sp. URHD0036 TaxID=1380356 RepID=UPI0004977BEC|nr:hypothetical protein [Blastococcus sp. URHD0036]
MRRPLYTAAVVLAATAGVLAASGPAAAEGGLVPGTTRFVPVGLDTGGWGGETPDRLEVAVSALRQAENTCLEPERDAADGCGLPGADLAADPGELAEQLAGSVAAGTRGRDGACDPLGDAEDLRLVAPDADASGDPVLRFVALSVGDPGRWDDVDCLSLALTFTDSADNNLAQSDAVDFALEVYALSSVPDVVPAPPGGGGTPGTGSGGTGTGGTRGAGTDVVGGPSAAGLGGSTGLQGGNSNGNGNGTGPVGLGAPAGDGGAAQGAPPGGTGTVIGRTTTSVSVDGDGVTAETVTQTQTRAAGQSLASAVMWAGGVFAAVLALGWFLFLVVRRRRRSESAA